MDTAGNGGVDSFATVRIELTYGWIMGYVYNASSGLGNVVQNRIGGAICNLENKETVISSKEEQNKGFFAFYSLSDGDYRITIYASKYELTTTTISVTAGKITWSSVGLNFTGKSDDVPPEVQHVPLSYIGIYGNKLKIVSIITDNNNMVQTAKMVYKLRKVDGTESEVKEINLLPSSESYVTDIPADEIDKTVDSIDYQIVAEDDDGNVTVAPSSGTFYSTQCKIYIEQSIGPSGGRIFLPDGNPDDGQVEVKLQSGVISNNTNVKLSQKESENLPAILNKDLVYDEITKPIAGYEITSSFITLDKPAELSLLYFDVDRDGIVDGTDIDESDLQIFWYDGKDWRYIGGTVDTEHNVITVKTSHFSLFGVFPVKIFDINAERFRPSEKIITPNFDGRNDFACFNGIHNFWAAASITGDTSPKEVRIYNIKNRLVRVIDSVDIWDGRDSDGESVENGIYLYQYSINGKMITGTIVIAK